MSRECPLCHSIFESTHRQKVYCSRRCGWLYRGRMKPKSADWADGHQPMRTSSCMGCRKAMLTRASRPLCDSCRLRRRREHSIRKNFRRRSAKLGERYAIEQVAWRDGWTCHLCDKPVDPALSYPDPMSASRDHVLPISLGGIDEAENVRLAHWICNSRRGARPLEAA